MDNTLLHSIFEVIVSAVLVVVFLGNLMRLPATVVSTQYGSFLDPVVHNYYCIRNGLIVRALFYLFNPHHFTRIRALCIAKILCQSSKFLTHSIFPNCSYFGIFDQLLVTLCHASVTIKD